MFRGFCLAAGLLVFQTFSAHALYADDMDNARQAIAGRLAEYDRGLLAGDAQAVVSVMDREALPANYRACSGEKQHQARSLLQAQLQTFTFIQLRRVIRDFVLQGNQAVVTVVRHSVLADRDPRVREQAIVAQDTVEEQTWIRRNAIWRERSSVTLWQKSVESPASEDTPSDPSEDNDEEPSAPTLTLVRILDGGQFTRWRG